MAKKKKQPIPAPPESVPANDVLTDASADASAAPASEVAPSMPDTAPPTESDGAPPAGAEAVNAEAPAADELPSELPNEAEVSNDAEVSNELPEPEAEPEATEPGLDVPAAEPAADAEDVSRGHLRGLVEALVFASDKPLKTGEIAKLASAPSRQIKEVLEELKGDYVTRGIQLDEVAGGWTFRTSVQYAPFVRDLTGQKPVKLSRAQLETLAIVAYRQPVTRPEVDDIRGVDCGPVLKTLLERDLVRIMGKKDEPGRPILYGTSNGFLELFNLKSLKDLPTLREFTELNEDSRKVVEEELGEGPMELGERPTLESIGAAGASMLGESDAAEAAQPAEPADPDAVRFDEIPAGDDDLDGATLRPPAPPSHDDEAADEPAEADAAEGRADEDEEADDEESSADDGGKKSSYDPADELEFPDDDDEDDDDDDDEDDEDDDDDDDDEDEA